MVFSDFDDDATIAATIDGKSSSFIVRKVSVGSRQPYHNMINLIDKALDEIAVQKESNGRRVKFCMEQKDDPVVASNNNNNNNNNNIVLSATEIHACWYTKREIRAFKKEGKQFGNFIRTNGRNCDGYNSLTQAHVNIRCAIFTDNNNDSCCAADSGEGLPVDDLKRWCAFQDGRRGLERYTNFECAFWLNKDVDNSRFTVLREQEKQKLRRKKNPKQIAKLYSKITKRSISFAQSMGAADAIEAQSSSSKNNNNNQETDNNVEEQKETKRDSMSCSGGDSDNSSICNISHAMIHLVRAATIFNIFDSQTAYSIPSWTLFPQCLQKSISSNMSKNNSITKS